MYKYIHYHIYTHTAYNIWPKATIYLAFLFISDTSLKCLLAIYVFSVSFLFMYLTHFTPENIITIHYQFT